MHGRLATVPRFPFPRSGKRNRDELMDGHHVLSVPALGEEQLTRLFHHLDCAEALAVYAESLQARPPVLRAERVLADRLVIQRGWEGLEVLDADHPLRRDAEPVARSLEAMDAGDWERAADLLRGIARRSPFAPWRLFCNAMVCFGGGDDEGLRRVLDLLPEDFPLAHTVAECRRACTGERRRGSRDMRTAHCARPCRPSTSRCSTSPRPSMTCCRSEGPPPLGDPSLPGGDEPTDEEFLDLMLGALSAGGRDPSEDRVDEPSKKGANAPSGEPSFDPLFDNLTSAAERTPSPGTPVQGTLFDEGLTGELMRLEARIDEGHLQPYAALRHQGRYRPPQSHPRVPGATGSARAGVPGGRAVRHALAGAARRRLLQHPRVHGEPGRGRRRRKGKRR